MEVSHTPVDKPTPRNGWTALQQLPQHVSALLKYESSNTSEFEDFERELHALFAHTECAVTEEALARYDVDLPFVFIDGVAGRCRGGAASQCAHGADAASAQGDTEDDGGRRGRGGARPARPDLAVVKSADGAKDNWTFLTGALPEGVELIDFFHAVEHLKDAFDTAHGADSPTAAAQFKKYRHRLRHEPDGVERVIRALGYLRSKSPGNERIAQGLGYFRGNRHRMGYADAKAKGLPIGSGVVEAACKTLVTERLKRSGMRWGARGGQAILTLRSLVQSHRFDHAWPVLAMTYRTNVACPDNVVPLS